MSQTVGNLKRKSQRTPTRVLAMQPQGIEFDQHHK